uniref:Uncharacterized protein n=1 Tax=Chromera velia CCMP2878 TaxID=1169474 RepID=A0A0K6S6S7_9ALVE|eukprot:Cvel_18770.t2-p1 / transcript=Cvel_18770.t2 / gene=Cvel_18770 / organism=Chromera_velia_CCMP2878 / gene_product=hypothetical protein / transcript_product=hypothetical protein / location=Cvel_scaffold1575:11993-13087(+) / protein_length=365 / sequence_SO=supercontig / SO=protein_coding / is_pseudo=false
MSSGPTVEEQRRIRRNAICRRCLFKLRLIRNSLSSICLPLPPHFEDDIPLADLLLTVSDYLESFPKSFDQRECLGCCCASPNAASAVSPQWLDEAEESAQRVKTIRSSVRRSSTLYEDPAPDGDEKEKSKKGGGKGEKDKEKEKDEKQAAEKIERKPKERKGRRSSVAARTKQLIRRDTNLFAPGGMQMGHARILSDQDDLESEDEDGEEEPGGPGEFQGSPDIPIDLATYIQHLRGPPCINLGKVHEIASELIRCGWILTPITYVMVAAAILSLRPRLTCIPVTVTFDRKDYQGSRHSSSFLALLVWSAAERACGLLCSSRHCEPLSLVLPEGRIVPSQVLNEMKGIMEACKGHVKVGFLFHRM